NGTKGLMDRWRTLVRVAGGKSTGHLPVSGTNINEHQQLMTVNNDLPKERQQVTVSDDDSLAEMQQTATMTDGDSLSERQQTATMTDGDSLSEQQQATMTNDLPVEQYEQLMDGSSAEERQTTEANVLSIEKHQIITMNNSIAITITVTKQTETTNEPTTKL